MISNTVNRWSQKRKQAVILLDSTIAAQEMAFLLRGEWDGCNSVTISNPDEVAVNTAVSLMFASWCYEGATLAVLNRLAVPELLRRYAIGERYFINANLKCAELSSQFLSEVNLSYAKLNFANLSATNLSFADLTAAAIQEANLSDANLKQSRFFKANLTKANLSGADLKGADLSHACLVNANLSGSDLSGTNLSQTDLRGADLSDTLFDEYSRNV